MAPIPSKKRKLEEPLKPTSRPPSKKSRRQHQYHSASPSPLPSNDEFPAVDLASSNSNSNVSSDHETESDVASASSNSSTKNAPPTARRKRNDPAVFANSMTKILASKLSTSKRSDPVLARSATAALANAELADSRLEIKARRKLREDRKLALEKGRVKDVLLGTDAKGTEGGDGSVGEAMELERRLRKTAQRGVVKLFNAVRAAQVKGEEAARQGGAAGRKRERVGEMSRQGFLELVAGGGKGKAAVMKEA